MEATQSLINSCGKLFPEWITHLKPPVCQSMERCYICGCCEISLNTKEVWNLIREYTGSLFVISGIFKGISYNALDRELTSALCVSGVVDERHG